MNQNDVILANDGLVLNLLRKKHEQIMKDDSGSPKAKYVTHPNAAGIPQLLHKRGWP